MPLKEKMKMTAAAATATVGSIGKNDDNHRRIGGNAKHDDDCSSNRKLLCPLFSTGISVDQVANHILPSLDRESRRSVLSIKSITEHFNLLEHYCPEHGTKLEANSDEGVGDEGDNNNNDDGDDAGDVKMEDVMDDVVRPTDGEEDVLPTENQEELDTRTKTNGNFNHDQDDHENDDAVTGKKKAEGDQPKNPQQLEGPPTTKPLLCEDCLEAERGNERCPDCEDFIPKEYLDTCTECQETLCEVCQEYSHKWIWECGSCDKKFCNQEDCLDPKTSGHCEGCMTFYCGKEGCRVVPSRTCCDESFCLECVPHPICAKCGKDHGCAGCLREPEAILEEGQEEDAAPPFLCGWCDSLYCHQCKDICDECSSIVCRECNNFSQCKRCKEKVFCSECKPHSCGHCGKEHGCKYCTVVSRNSYFCTGCNQCYCTDCKDYQHYHCPRCDNDVCQSCTPAFHCSFCKEKCCKSCKFSEKAGCHCGKNVRNSVGLRVMCAACAINSDSENKNTFVCGKCKGGFCIDCTGCYYCGECEKFFCQACKSSYFCERCEEAYCKSCKPCSHCQDCNELYCSSCVFKCLDCGISVCLSCPSSSEKSFFQCKSCEKRCCRSCTEVTSLSDDGCNGKVCGDCTKKNPTLGMGCCCGKAKATNSQNSRSKKRRKVEE